MKYVWLRYKDTTGTFQDLRVMAASSRYKKVSKDNAIQVAMSGNEYEHTLSFRYTYELVLNRNEVTATADYVELWYVGPDRYIAFNESATVPVDAEFISVSCGNGTAPIDFLQNHYAMPRYRLELREKENRLI